jgi:hypothetical protein
VKFDAMQLALFSFDECSRRDKGTSDWFDLELSRAEPNLAFRISGLLRRIREESLVPIAVDWPKPKQ